MGVVVFHWGKPIKFKKMDENTKFPFASILRCGTVLSIRGQNALAYRAIPLNTGAKIFVG